MKKLSYKLLLAGLLFIAASSDSIAQNKDAATNKRIITERNFVFVAQQASSSRGASIPLSGGYDLTISGDSMVAYLPFYGRAYTAPIGGEGGIQFTSTAFKYAVTEKKNRWEIKITPSDASSVQQMYLDVTANGYANLRVTNANRSPMTFSGYIVEGKTKEKKAF
jgi:hypothetical protein